MSSYDPHRTTAGGFDAEVERLEQQARLSWDDEWPVLAGLGLEQAGLLVEVGCGPGAVTRRLLDRLDATVLAVDLSVELLTLAPSQAARAAADAVRLPLPDGRADAVLLRYVLQHVADPAAVLREAARVSRPGGRVVVVDVDAQLWGAAEPTLPGLAAVYRKVGMIQRDHGGDRLVARRVPGLLAAAGFDDVRVLPFATTSDRHRVEDFAMHAGPERLLPLVHSGELTLQDYAVAVRGWKAFCALPQAWVMALGFVVTAINPS
jgi:SAM-dependent methyltransferase